MAETRTAVAVYLKYPDPGYVKTRLARDCGENIAAAVALKMVRALLESVLAKLPEEDFLPILLCDPLRSLDDYSDLLGEWRWQLQPQVGAELGERLRHSFTELLNVHPAVIAIGTDCPGLTVETLVGARERLYEDCDLVVGPADDGGYYLIGMRRSHPTIFEGIAWGGPRVLSQTLQCAESLKLSTALLAALRDLDTLEDLKYWREKGWDFN